MSINSSGSAGAAGPSKKTGLGRGLGSLIPSAPVHSARGDATIAKEQTVVVKEVIKEVVPTDSSMVLQIPVGKISPNPMQPRAVFGHQELEDLMNSIAEHGILQPITVTKRGDDYEIVAGERRYRAAKMLGLEKVPAIVREADAEEKLVLALIENIQRENLNAIEEAKAYQQLADEHGFIQSEIAKKVGKASSTVANTIRLLSLPREVQDAISLGKIPPGSARAILALPDEEQQLKFFRSMLNEKMSTREVERRIRNSGAAPRTQERDPGLLAVEDSLRDALGARVEVKKKNGQGSIVISFYSDAELAGLVKKLSSEPI